jgi:hypothetical protein
MAFIASLKALISISKSEINKKHMNDDVNHKL